MTVLIKGGTVVSSTGADPAEVLIDGETIVAVLQPGCDMAISAEGGAERVIDATGKYVIPGGVDCHTHMELPFGGTNASDDFENGTKAAAWGGTTTIVDFAVQSFGNGVRESLDTWFAKAEGNCAIDYGFHMIIGDVNDDSLKAMDVLVDEGISSFKLFMAYPGVFLSDDAQILRAMQQSADNGSMIMMHAENGIAIDLLAQQAIERGETAPINHGSFVGPNSRARRPTAPSNSPKSVLRRSTSCTSPPARRSNRSPSHGARAPTCSPRPARSTCTSTSKTISASPASKEPATSARPHCARNTNIITRTCGKACA